MSTFEAYVTLGAMSIAVSAVGAALKVESKVAAVAAPTAVLTVLLPREPEDVVYVRTTQPGVTWNHDECEGGA